MIQDLCIIMLTAGLVSLLFKILRQPVVLGYIVAGIFVGPYVFGESWVSDSQSVDTWGQIGVLFLLFALGLEFSFKKLIQVGSTALIAAVTIACGMMSLGFITGRLFGMDEINSLFLGGMLCMSSTTIVFKALDDMGLRGRQFANICFGILVVEDLFAVVLMVLLSSIATTRSFEGETLLFEVGKLVGYLVLWFVLGISILPTFLRRFKRLLNDETLTIFAVGLCLGMVLLAVSAGFSSALGAFVMGSLLAETLEAERIEHLMEPVKNIFGSIFFVSVGMMINPSLLAEHWFPIVVLTLIVILGQIIFATFGTLLSGQSLKVSLQTGFSLVQIGEFAFIIANLGQSLGVIADSLYPIIVAVSVITTFLTPYVMRGSEPIFRYFDSHLSTGTKMFLQNYARSRTAINAEQSTFRTFLQKTFTAVIVNSIILVFIYLLFFKTISPWLDTLLPQVQGTMYIKIPKIILLLAVSSPFIYAISHAGGRSEESRKLWNSGTFQKARLLGVALVRILVCVAFVAYAALAIFGVTSGIATAASILLVIVIMFSRHVRKQSHALSFQFNQNLSARDIQAEKHRSVSRAFEGSLLSYDVHLSEFQLTGQSTLCGRSLQSLKIREQSGATLVRIVRSGININIPGGRTVLYPGDRLIVCGSDEQIEKFGNMLEHSMQKQHGATASSQMSAGQGQPITLTQIEINDTSPLLGKTIAQSAMRERAQCIVVAVERDDTLISNPDPSLTFHVGDIVMLAGEAAGMQTLF